MALFKKKQKQQRLSFEKMAQSFLPKDVKYSEDPTCGEQIVFNGIALADVAGSWYDYEEMRPDRIPKNLWSDKDLSFSGNTVLADAVMNATKIMLTDDITEHKEIEKLYEKFITIAEREHPNAGFEDDFIRWAENDMSKEEAARFQSMEDSCAVRAAVIGAMFDTPEEVIKYAMLSAMPTHSHPEGLRGAAAAAMCVFMACHECSKKDILEYASKMYPEDGPGIPASSSLYDLQYGKKSKNSAVCPVVVPEAIICFLESDSYESALKNALGIIGDNCAMTAIAGAIAAAYYGKTVEKEKILMNQFVNKKLK